MKKAWFLRYKRSMSARLWLRNNNEELMPLLMLARAKLKNWLGPSIACFRGTVASLAPVDLLWGFIHVLPDPKPEGPFSEKLSCTNDQRNYLHWRGFGDIQCCCGILAWPARRPIKKMPVLLGCCQILHLRKDSKACS